MGLSADQGEEALLAAATRGNAEPAASLLATVTEYPDVDPWDHWNDDGGSWWDPTAGAVLPRTRLIVAYLMLYGSGWTQRWRIPEGMEDQVRAEISQVGTQATGSLSVVDPGSDAEVTLVIAWGQVAAAVVIQGAAGSGEDIHDRSVRLGLVDRAELRAGAARGWLAP